MVAAIAERRGAARADPLVAAGVAFLLFFEPLLEQLHQLVPAVLLDGGLFLGRQALFELLDQPIRRHLAAFGQRGRDALVVRAEGLVVAVVQRFILHQRGARQEAEIVQRRRHQVVAQRVHQRQVLVDRDGQLVRPQVVEEIDQHGGAGARLSGVVRGSWRPGGRAGACPARSEQRAGHQRYGRGGVRVDLGGGGVFGQQQAQPVQQFGRRRLFFRPGASRSAKKLSSAARSTSCFSSGNARPRSRAWSRGRGSGCSGRSSGAGTRRAGPSRCST